MKSTSSSLQFIQTQSDLQAIVSRMREARRIGLDTEADSLHHYREKVCLIQVGFDRTFAAIDPLAGLDLSAFFRVLAGKPLIVHGGDYDCRMLHRGYAFRPHKEVFDTVMAAQLLGYTHYSLPALADRLVGVHLTKNSQKTDWARRPLTPAQLAYALDDVRHLEVIADKLGASLDALGRSGWHREACRHMVTASAAPVRRRVGDRWRVKGTHGLTTRQLAFVRAIWLWREREARRADRPTFKILGAPALIELAIWAAERPSARLEQGPALPRDCRGRRRLALEKAIDHARHLPPSRWPSVNSRTPRAVEDAAVRARIRALTEGRDKLALTIELPPSLLAPRAALLAIARQQPTTTAELIECSSLLGWQAKLLKPIVENALRSTLPPSGRT